MSEPDLRHRAFAVTALAIFAFDRLSKMWAEGSLEPGERVSLVDGFLYVTHVRNAGGAFGIFADAPVELKAIVFGGAAVLALAVVISLLRSLAPREGAMGAALGLVAAGALGNVYDRLPPLGTGEVVDVLHVRLWGGYPWPDFNVADTAILLGVAALIIDLLAREASERAAGGTDAAHDAVDTDESRP